MSKRRPNLKDVAKLAEVSPATVSVVINNRIGKNIRVSEETRQRIIDAVEMLGYVANPAARSLAGQQNRIISIFTYEPIFPLEYHNFYYPFLVGIEKEAEQQGYDLLLMTSTGGDGETRAMYRDGMNRLKLADGAILLGLSRNEEEILSLLQEGFPVVFIGHREFPGADVSYVAGNYTEATAEIVTYIVNKGHRQIALIMDSNFGHSEPSSDREAGYRIAHKILELSLRPDLIVCKSLESISEQFLDQFFRTGVTALIVESYAIAYKILNVAKNLCLDVPKDFSIAVLAGPGGPPEPANVHVDWTTFTIPSEEMGRQAVRLLVKLLEETSAPPLRISLDCSLVRGTTVGKGPYKEP